MYAKKNTDEPKYSEVAIGRSKEASRMTGVAEGLEQSDIFEKKKAATTTSTSRLITRKFIAPKRNKVGLGASVGNKTARNGYGGGYGMQTAASMRISSNLSPSDMNKTVAN